MAKADFTDLPVVPGQVIAGRYAVSGVLGKGGMGVVLAGKHLELGERVAIKFLHKEHAAHADRFFREARAAARIRSEHVVRIYDVGRLPTGEPYIVMEHLKGEDVAARLERKGKIEPQEVADMLLDVCQALAEAHAAGIVHRDLKPANIFLARGPGGGSLVKLLDFGIAKVPEGGSITRTASILGSPVYMSPEQLVASRDVDARSDIWSLGIILHELLTGVPPFEGDSLVHLAILVREKPTPKARDLCPEIPEALDDVISKCLSKDRSHRFSDVGEFAEALLPFASPGLVHSTPRIRRVLDEAKHHGKPELASTIPPPSGEEEFDVEVAESLSVSRATGSPTMSLGKQLSASLVAVSSQISLSASTPITQPSPVPALAEPRKMSLLRVGIVAGAVVALGAVALTFRAGSSVEPKASATAIPVSAPAAPPPPVSSVPETPSAGAAPPTSSDALPVSAPPPSATLTRPVVKKGTHPTHAPAPMTSSSAVIAAPTTKPSANCNPPFIIDDKGMRRPKPECL